MTRRSFISFVLLGGFAGSLLKRFWTARKERIALFWRKKDEA